ncbi:GreA/GreB family elongation factor [Patescibacteria group bacterium]|nr:GreA/GreB family elongation factor [Patescibacteria group bacterium]
MEERTNFYLTKEGLKQIKKEYEDLKKLRVAKVKDDVPGLLESEDLNPDYIAFQEDLNFLEGRIEELETIIEKASIIKKPAKTESSKVDLGATVDVSIDGHKAEFVIVGTLEANPVLGRISNESPVGRALIGKKAGEEIVISEPNKSVYKIRKVYYN